MFQGERKKMYPSWGFRLLVCRTVQLMGVEVKHGLQGIYCSTNRHLAFCRLEGRSKSNDKHASILHNKQVYHRRYMLYIDRNFRPVLPSQPEDIDNLLSSASGGTHGWQGTGTPDNES